MACLGTTTCNHLYTRPYLRRPRLLSAYQKEKKVSLFLPARLAAYIA